MTIKRNFSSTLSIALLLFITQLILNGCAIQKKIVPVGKPSVSGPTGNLLLEAEQEMQYARYEKAEILAERALRIEPHNPGTWQLMGRIQSALNNYSEAIQFYNKSNSLAGNDMQLIKQNRIFIEAANKKMVKN